MSYSEYYRERAAEAERNASATALPLVREQYLKAARSWSQLASHIERVERYRGGNLPGHGSTAAWIAAPAGVDR